MVCPLISSNFLTSADGMMAVVSRTNLDKMLSGSAVHKSESAAEHALAVANLDVLFAQAVTGWAKADRDADANISAIRRMFAPMRVGDKARLVKLTVKEYAQAEHGNRVYSVEALQVGEVSPVPEMVDADMAEGHRLPTGPTGLADTVVERIQDFNKNGASKVVSPNGEPLVVYHGTDKWFNEFRKDKLGSRESKFFFTGSQREARQYAGGREPMAVFLSAPSIRLFTEDNFIPSYSGDYALDVETDWSEYAVSNPTQIKSATGNTGAFGAANPNIRFSSGMDAKTESTYPLSKDQSAAEKLNHGLAEHFKDPAWENAYVQRNLPDRFNAIAETARAAFGTQVVGITATEQRFNQFNGINLR